MKQEDIWDADAARSYDTPGEGMFAPDVLNPTVQRLAQLAAGGRVLEFAIGTGRVAVPLLQMGVPVAGIELSRPMIDQLRTKIDESSLPVVQGDMTIAVAPDAQVADSLVDKTPQGTNSEVPALSKRIPDSPVPNAIKFDTSANVSSSELSTDQEIELMSVRP